MSNFNEQLGKLQDKYSGMGQDMSSYLEGLYHSNGLTYWEYLHLESLLGLQTPRTKFKDEIVFISYHQIVELYFKLIKLEIDELTDKNKVLPEFENIQNWYKRITRLLIYFEHLCRSFNIMMNCLDKNEFRQFRMSLLPASGFQSVQFRHIEIMSAKLYNLLTLKERGKSEAPLNDLYKNIYWKKGGYDFKTKDKSLTLKDFEQKYDDQLKNYIEKYRFRNLDYTFNSLPREMKNDKRLRSLLKEYDVFVNYHWKMSHFIAISRHLKKGDPSTGGTNWHKYLPPDSDFQRIIFFEELWTQEELKKWGNTEMKKEFREKVAQFWDRK